MKIKIFKEDKLYKDRVKEFKALIKNDSDSSWKKGDLIIELVYKYGKSVIKSFGVSVGVGYFNINEYYNTSLVFKEGERIYDLTWSHYYRANKHGGERANEWLATAEENRWTVERLKKEILKETELKTFTEPSHTNPYDSNVRHLTAKYHERRFGDEVIVVDTTHDSKDIRPYKRHYPTLTRIGNFFHNDGTEFNIREYAKVQDFPDDFIFVGTPTDQEIKNQIGEAVSPKMAEYIIKKYIKRKTYLELFCGCGGFSLGAHRLGKKCLFALDFNRYAINSFHLNFPDVRVLFADITKTDEKRVHKEVGNVDFIIGGPPCQGLSMAGKRLGFKEDERNQLYLDFLRFVKEFKPGQFIMENVKEIEEHKDEIIRDFNKIGYSVKTELVNGLDIGMKQKRIRFFFIGEIK